MRPSGGCDLKMGLLKGYPNLCIRFDTKDFLKGAALDQMNFVTAGIAGGLMTPNEAREYMNMPNIEGGDELLSAQPKDISATNVPIGAKTAKITQLPGSSPQDTGGGGGNQTKKMNIGK